MHSGIQRYYRDCLKFAFIDVIQLELDNMTALWNNHCIRANKVYGNGIPNDMYYLPEHRGRV